MAQNYRRPPAKFQFTGLFFVQWPGPIFFENQTHAMQTNAAAPNSTLQNQRAAPPKTLRQQFMGVACAALFASGLCSGALAQAPSAPGAGARVYAEVGWAQESVQTTSMGMNLPWSFERQWLGGQLTGHWDAYISQWRAHNASQVDARERWTQLALVPSLRLRFSEGRSPWFIEGGIGVSVLDSHYITRDKTFSTRFNFADHLALGWSFGSQRQHELMLILRHVSNAGIKKPNPGEDFVQVRYSMAF